MFKEKEEHPSFGLISWSKMQSTGTKLFGSDLIHGDLIAIRVMQASRERGLSRTWYHGRKEVCEVYLSAHQFSEFLTSPNQGDGIPCTIRATAVERNIDYPDTYESERALHTKEFKNTVVNIAKKGNDLRQKLKDITEQKTVRKSDVKELTGQLEMLLQDIRSNLPFVLESFQEEMDNTVAAGKHEIENYISSRLEAAGLEHIKEHVKSLPKIGED